MKVFGPPNIEKLKEKGKVERLIKALKDKRVSSMAAKALSELGDTRAVEPLIKALSFTFGFDEESIAEALGKLGDNRAVEPLCKLLESNASSWGREAAVKALVKLGDLRAIEPLIKALEDKEEKVSGAAARALAMLGDARAVEPLIVALGFKYWGNPKAAAEALVELGEYSVDPLIKAIEDYPENRDEILFILQDLGNSRAVEPVIKALLEDKDEYIRNIAAKVLGELGDTRAVDPLIKALGDKYDETRISAAKSLGKLGDARAVEPLIKTLDDKNYEVKGSAAEVLGNLGDSRAIEPLFKSLGNKSYKDNWGRISIAKALGKLGDPRATEPLIQALRSDAAYIRKDAAEAISKLEAYSSGLLIKALGDDSNYTAEELEKNESLIEIMGNLGDTCFVEPLVNALKNRYSRIREKAAISLGKIGDKRALKPLFKMLEDENWGVRRSTTEALGISGDNKAVNPLINTLGDVDWRVREGAAEALDKLGESKWKNIFKSDYHSKGFDALAKCDDPRALEPLLRALVCSEKDVRISAAHSIIYIANNRPRLLFDQWNHIEAVIQKAHADSHVDNPGCSGFPDIDYHKDNGIGLDFPKKPNNLDF